MSYFPTFVNLENKKVLIVGGGKIAYDKLKKLLDFTQNISIISTEISDQTNDKIQKHDLKLIKRKYEKGDIKECDIVVVAVDDLSLQAEIFQESKNYKCLCNCVDSTKYCDFIFPSYIKNDDLIIAISTSGSSPALAKHLKEYLKKLIPDSVGEFLKQMKEFRKTMPKGKERMKFLDNKAKNFINSLPKN